jgi:hypothetical protein
MLLHYLQAYTAAHHDEARHALLYRCHVSAKLCLLDTHQKDLLPKGHSKWQTHSARQVYTAIIDKWLHLCSLSLALLQMHLAVSK